MQCSVIIPCHGGAELTRACLASLLGQTGAHDLELLLVDNAGDAATAALADLDPRVRVLPQAHNLGFAGGTNVGLRAAQRPFVLMLNNDTQAAPHMLAALGRALDRDDRIALAAPVSNFVKGEAAVAFGDRGRTHEGRLEIEAALAAHAGIVEDVEALTGLCLLARRATLLHIGLFDERYGFGNYEDDDLSLRARRLGHRLVIARDAFLHHEGHRTFQRLGLDLEEELARRRAQFRGKWSQDPCGRALLRAADGNAAAAARLAAIARRVQPQWPDADLLLGRDLAAGGRPADAAVQLESFLRECPQHTGAVILLGMCWLQTGQPARAERLWRWALGACHFTPPAAADLLRRLGEHAHARGDLAQAAAHFAHAVELDPDDPALLNRLGVAQLELRHFGAAIAALERAAAAGFALAHTNLGICHFQNGDAPAALRHFAEAARMLPADATAQQNHARARAALAGAKTPGGS